MNGSLFSWRPIPIREADRGRSHARVPLLQPAWNSPPETYPDMTDIRLI